MLGYLALAIYMSLFVVRRWNRHILTASYNDPLHEQENTHLL